MPSSLRTLYHHALRLTARFTWLGPLVVRLVIGVAFVVTGWGKLHNLDKVTEYFASLHIPLPGAQAAFVSTGERVGGDADHEADHQGAEPGEPGGQSERVDTES